MSTITVIAGTDIVSTSRPVINTNFANLNADKLEADDLLPYLTEAEADLLYQPIGGGGGSAPVFIQDTTPVFAGPYIWFDTTGGNLQLWIEDGV